MPPSHAIPADAVRLSNDMPRWHAFFEFHGAGSLTHEGHVNHPLPMRTQKGRAMCKHSATFQCLNVYMNMQLLVSKSLHDKRFFVIF